MDQGNCGKFCVKNEIKSTRTEMLTVAFGKSTMSRTQVQLWYNRFKESREDVNDDTPPTRQQLMKTLTVESLLETLLMMLAYRSAICQAIFTDVLSMKFAAGRLFENC